MIEAIVAIILLVAAAVLYFWGRRSPQAPASAEDPDVILGLSSSPVQPAEPPPPPESQSSPEPEPSATPPVNSPLQRQILFLRAPGGKQFSGYELLQSLLACGLRFGENQIFHRYEQHAESQTLLFSVAAATRNGTLNPADMGDFMCPGLSLFLTLNQHIYPSVNFELMLDTARQLHEDLGGILLDESQQPLTADRLQKIREKIKYFETSQQTMELFV